MLQNRGRSFGVSFYLVGMATGLFALFAPAAAGAQPTLVEYPVESVTWDLGLGPQGIAAGNGEVWFANVLATHSIASVTTAGDTSNRIQPVGDSASGAVAAGGPNSTVWLGGYKSIFYVNRTPGLAEGVYALAPVPGGYHQIDSIAWDGANSVWFTDHPLSTSPAWQSPMLGQLNLNAAGTPNEIPLPSNCSSPGLFGRDMTKGSDGNMWFTAANFVCRILPDGTVDSVALPTGLATGIASGWDGRVWVGAYDGQHGYLQAFVPSHCPGAGCQISVYPVSGPPPSAGREIHRIAAGPDGRIWFVFDKDGEGVGSLKTDGTDVQTFLLPTRSPNGNRPHRITAGPAGDNSVWFTEPASGRIGRVTGLAAPTAMLLQGGRFKVEVNWAVPPQGTSGVGTAVPIASNTGAFWFFSPTNLELVVKVLDGRTINGHWWVFLGLLTNVQFDVTVTDLSTGAVRTYHNPYGSQQPVQDTTAFSTFSLPQEESRISSLEASPAPSGPDPADLVRAELASERSASTESAQTACTPDAQSLCLAASRFKVQVAWSVPAQGTSGNGTAVPLTSDTGVFWFFSSDNLELILKVLDARVVNNHFWVFYGALSNVQYTITITDTQTGAVKTYVNPSGNVATVADTSAF